MTHLEILKRARELLTPPGSWCQGALEQVGQGGPQRCLHGAILRAVNPQVRLGTYLLEYPSEEGQNIWRLLVNRGFHETWNDKPGRTQAEVLAALDAVIAQEEAQ